ncbi:hypothetical protein C882_2925 [Caenispirillum salinarum AK4]|uniref:DUF1232 domain-containing protein n=1 Tax=Caenispirillum salinarum AK4 TaxID=1238182 RepID=K9GM92_9PROT|nr:DUF1232 domain-containing protein [Caenispirillum salinarum]EKV26157.1 hypothetical protein C882_2925 [Caenispirillum salinarum AK4]
MGVLDRIDTGFLKRGARSVRREDVTATLRRAREVETKMTGGALARFAGEGRLLLRLLDDWRTGRYRDVSWKTIASVVFALLYVLNPMDLMPDVIIATGLLDDATVLGLALKLIGQDLRRYEAWRAGTGDAAFVPGPAEEAAAIERGA